MKAICRKLSPETKCQSYEHHHPRFSIGQSILSALKPQGTPKWIIDGLMSLDIPRKIYKLHKLQNLPEKVSLTLSKISVLS